MFDHMNDSKIIFFKDLPLFHRASFHSNYKMEGELKEYACFFYVNQGAMTSYDGRGRHHTDSKNAILKNCGRYVQEFSSEKKNSICEVVAVYLYPKLLKEIYKEEVPSFIPLDNCLPPKKLIGNQLIEQFMSNLSIYFEEPEALDEELGILKLKELILILLKSESHKSIRQFLSEVFTPVNLSLKKVIENNLYNNLGTEQLAFLCNMSLSTFKREFKKTFADTPARYIKNRRLTEAKKLLLTTEESITQIAFSLGFVDVSTFSDNFQKKFGSSPSKFRMNQIGPSLDPFRK